MKHHENPKINAKEKVHEEKKRKGPKAKLKRRRNQKHVSCLKKRSTEMKTERAKDEEKPTCVVEFVVFLTDFAEHLSNFHEMMRIAD